MLKKILIIMSSLFIIMPLTTVIASDTQSNSITKHYNSNGNISFYGTYKYNDNSKKYDNQNQSTNFPYTVISKGGVKTPILPNTGRNPLWQLLLLPILLIAISMLLLIFQQKTKILKHF